MSSLDLIFIDVHSTKFSADQCSRCEESFHFDNIPMFTIHASELASLESTWA